MTNKYLEKIAQIGAIDWHVRGHGDLSPNKERLTAAAIGATAAAVPTAVGGLYELHKGVYKDVPLKTLAGDAAKVLGKRALIGAGIGAVGHTIASEYARRKMNEHMSKFPEVYGQ